MKNYFKDLRNWYHILISIALGYDITLLLGFPNRENFPLSLEDFRTILAPIVGAITIGFAAFQWEKRQDKIAIGSSDMRDVYISMIAAYIGGVVSLYFPNLITSIILTGIAFVVFMRNYKK
tara:strand:+ start:12 stop:374 length:363 start_codon:yes stop_codon:yes gene_type:complete